MQPLLASFTIPLIHTLENNLELNKQEISIILVIDVCTRRTNFGTECCVTPTLIFRFH